LAVLQPDEGIFPCSGSTDHRMQFILLAGHHVPGECLLGVQGQG
jgi:hypothetical protein